MRESENHFNDAQWTDFIRDAATSEVSGAIRAHLDAGCEECAGTQRLLEGLHRMGLSEGRDFADPAMVRRAKSLFRPPLEDRSWIEALREVAASLVKEMRPEWASAGVRSAAGASQRMLFRAGDFSVDLNLDAAAEAGQGEIVGQIANEGDRSESVEGIVVQLVSTGKTLGETTTNRFGEFMMECPAGKAVVLRLALRARGERIDLPLNQRKSKK